MTATPQPSGQVDGADRRQAAVAASFSPEPGATRVDVPLGRRVMVVSDLLLTPEATPSTLAVTGRAGPGPRHLGRPGHPDHRRQPLRPLGMRHRPWPRRAGRSTPTRSSRRSLDRFLEVDERRILRQTGTHEPGFDTDPEPIAAIAASGVEQLGPVDLHLQTATGVRVVRVEPGEHAYAPGCPGTETEFDPAADAKPGVIGPTPAGRRWRSLAARSTEDAPWLAGLNRLSDPSALSRFVVSRTLYRRLGRYAWWLLVPFAVAGLLRVAITPWVLGPPGIGAAGPGHPPRPPGRPRRPDRRRPRWSPWSCWWCWRWSSACSAAGCGRSSAAARWTRCAPRPGPTTRPGTPGGGWWAGATPD